MFTRKNANKIRILSRIGIVKLSLPDVVVSKIPKWADFY